MHDWLQKRVCMQTVNSIERINASPSTPGLPCPDSPENATHPIWLAAAKLVVIGLLVMGALASRTGMLTAHMAGHIAVMNLLAPTVAWLFRHRFFRIGSGQAIGRKLLLATLTQLSVFFLWHSPPVMAISMQGAVTGFALLAGLLMVSVWFWACVFEAVRQNRMEVIAALLITGKLVCLIAVLLVFAPRLIYPGMGVPAAMMGDQQLAGLLMLSACPLTYVGASIYVVARWFTRLSSPPLKADR